MLKLLFITQKVDREDDILGVYHEWIRRLAGKLELINVICLQKGATQLSHNVQIFSLGKEHQSRTSRFNLGVKLRYLLSFYKYIFYLRRDYDIVFVHMNSSYVLLGWFWWKLWGKKIVFWNANYKVGWPTKLALLLSDQGLTSVREAFLPESKKVIAVGQGIDIELFQRDQSIIRQSNCILFLGRISPVKNLNVLIEAMKILQSSGVIVKLSIVGEPMEADKKYYRQIKQISASLNEGSISFLGRVPHYQTPQFYNINRLFVNLTDSGSFDKSILEAMACETLVLVSNSIYRGIFNEELAEKLMFLEKTPKDLARQIKNLISLPSNTVDLIGKQLREIVIRDHSLDNLTIKLANIFNSL